MKKLLLIAMCFVAIYTQVSAFATIYHSIQGGDLVEFNTNIDGVSIYLGAQKIGVTNNKNYKFKIQNRDGLDKTVTFKKEGYEDATVVIGTTFDPVFYGNFIVFGSIGSSVDSMTTKNVRKYSPNQFFVELNKEK